MGRYKLENCPRCGMDSGERKTFDGPEEKYLVICTTCGYHTRWHPTQPAASNEWNSASKEAHRRV